MMFVKAMEIEDMSLYKNIHAKRKRIKAGSGEKMRKPGQKGRPTAKHFKEAKGNWFQSSWRPLIGWICGLSLAINYMVSPILAGFGIIIPQADMSVMMPLLFGMLGIAGMRSYDKTKKVDTKN